MAQVQEGWARKSRWPAFHRGVIKSGNSTSLNVTITQRMQPDTLRYRPSRHVRNVPQMCASCVVQDRSLSEGTEAGVSVRR